ncbi:MAG TPA: hypothetical protein VGQ55_04210 [Pyrinomonadaceae bacterium]|nr:hypothetical protein [Pyrinomonadaceae bacterium]
MLVIRKEQLEVMEAAAAVSFEDRLIEHIKQFAPLHTQTIGDEVVRSSVHDGIERAKKYGFTKQGPVRFFVELMIMFGTDFDTDPLLPWAHGVLNNESIHDEMERADILHDEMVKYSDEVAGSDKKDLFDALRKLSRARFEDYQSANSNFDDTVRSGLNNIYPNKCKYLGEDALSDLIRRGKDAARVHEITAAQGAALLIILMFELGHKITEDPLYPWVSGTLSDESIGDPNERVKRLQARVKTYLDQALKNLGQDTVSG